VRPFDEDDELTARTFTASGGARPFAADEMVACADCARANPPTRMNCLYCGARLPLEGSAAERLRPALRRLEEWEEGHNVVLEEADGRGLSPEAEAEAAKFLKLEPEQLSPMLAAGTALPLARAASIEEAGLVVGRLAALGLRTFAVGDEELRPDEPPRRARGFEWRDEGLSARVGAGGERVEWKWDEVSLLVMGRLVSRRVEVEERQARLGMRNEFVEAREMAADESVLDLYAGADEAGLRVHAGGFDYSCLGAEKSLLAGENFAALVRALRGRVTGAAFDDSYMRVRHLLSAAWPPAEKTESGLRRDRPGRFNTEAVTIVSNETQFTRYSRLLFHLARRGRAETT
jgi:hypothetical protein